MNVAVPVEGEIANARDAAIPADRQIGDQETLEAEAARARRELPPGASLQEAHAALVRRLTPEFAMHLVVEAVWHAFDATEADAM
jgi:hypothetical protein